MKIARMALDVPLNELFDYQLPEQEEDVLGLRALVSFGRRPMVGVIMEVASSTQVPPGKLKPVTRLLRDAPPLPAPVRELITFCANYYHHPLGAVVFAALPALLRDYKPVPSFDPIFYTLTDAGRQVSVDQLPKRAPVRRRLLGLLQASGALSLEDIKAVSPSAVATLREWLHQGWVGELRLAPDQPDPIAPSGVLALNPEQAAALDALSQSLGQFKPWLLQGITGSGKTEVYMQLIQQVLQGRGQVLVLVPEINLTPQLEQRFYSRFPGVGMVSLHSNLGPTERLRNWLKAASGDARIVLGTRLSVFTPLPDLALIIVDEEHDPSFKQQDGLRYSARDVAILRAKQAEVPIVLGSATPSLETFFNAQAGRFGHLVLSYRAVTAAQLPDIHCVDTRYQRLMEGMAEPIVTALQENILRGEQSMVFINRRGYAPVLYCAQCGWQAACHRCSARLVVHLGRRELRCHHCGQAARIPAACPSCGEIDLATLGHGTQRLEDALSILLPTARILRMDRDSTRRKNALNDMIRQVQQRQVDVLVGTQMLAKGHDFPHLTLVVVLDIDSALYSADFRASERLFAQLLQVAGRAGRGELPGRVLIQTQFPSHPLFTALKRQDYSSFAEAVLDERRQAQFPPFCYQALLRAEAEHIAPALYFLEQAARLAADLPYPVEVFDPVPAQMLRLNGRERAQLLVQSASRQALHVFLNQWLPAVTALPAKHLKWLLEVDPTEF